MRETKFHNPTNAFNFSLITSTQTVFHCQEQSALLSKLHKLHLTGDMMCKYMTFHPTKTKMLLMEILFG